MDQINCIWLWKAWKRALCFAISVRRTASCTSRNPWEWAADGASDTANATGKAGGTSDTSTAADGAGNSNSQMPNGFDPNNLPEGFDLSNLPEGLDLSNLPEGFDSSNMPAMGNANSGNMAQQSSSKTKNLIIYGSCFVLIIAALILVWCIRRRRNR